MSRGFRPPPLAGFYAVEDADPGRALAEAREQGYADGHAQGLLEGHAAGASEAAAATRDAMQPELDVLRETCAKQDARNAVYEAMRGLLAARHADLAALELDVRRVAAAALNTLFPTLLARAAGTGIAALLADALAERVPETLILRAHPETLAAVAAEIAAEREDGRLTLVPDPAQPFGTAEIAWSGGGISFDPAALLARVTSVLTAGDTEAFPKPQPLKALP